MEPVTRVAYGPILLGLIAPPEVVEAVQASMAPFFDFRPGSGTEPFEALIVGLTSHGAPDDPARRPEPERVQVDTSYYAHLRSEGERWEDDESILVHIDLHDTWVHIDKKGARLEVRQPHPAYLAVEIERLIKSLTTIFAERAGAIQCHAAGVTGRDDPEPAAILLLGDMWQGKTTVLLEMLNHFKVDQLSCDTVMIFPRAAGGDLVRGWPSPFSVSHGTMSDHEALTGSIPGGRQSLSYDQLWKEGRKSVFRSADIVELFGAGLRPGCRKIAATILLRFRWDEPVGIRAVESVEDLRAVLKDVYLGSRDPIYHNWHRWSFTSEDAIENNIAAIAAELLEDSPVHQITWAPSVVSLLRRIDPVAPLHRHASLAAQGSERAAANG